MSLLAALSSYLTVFAEKNNECNNKMGTNNQLLMIGRRLGLL